MPVGSAPYSRYALSDLIRTAVDFHFSSGTIPPFFVCLWQNEKGTPIDYFFKKGPERRIFI